MRVNLFGLGKMRYRKYLDLFLAFKSTKSKRTIEFYHSRLTQFCGFAGNAWPPTPEIITRFLQYQQDRKLADGSVHASYRAIRAWCYWMQKERILTDNPIIHVDAPPKTKRRIPRAPKREDVEGLFRYFDVEVGKVVRNDRLRNWMLIRDMSLISLLTFTGLRIGEVKHALVNHINLDKGFVYVSDRGKDREERYVPIDSDTRLAADLRLWLSVRNELDVNGTKALFVSNARTPCFVPLDIWGIEDALERHVQAAGVGRFTPKQLRSYYAVCQIKKGVDIMTLRDYLGHSSVDTTDIYLRSPDVW